MKKLTIVLTVLSVVFFAACGGGGEPKKAEAEKTPGKTEMAKEEPAAKKKVAMDLSAGEAIYNGKGTCATCHKKDGTGLDPAFPPLANADYLLADVDRAIAQTMYGSKEPITVNGKEYSGGMMTTVDLTDQEVMDVVNYILNSWGNNGGTVTLDQVKAQRK